MTPPEPAISPEVGLVLKGVALVIFLAIFLFVLVRLITRRPGAYDKTARIPLEDDVVEPRNERGKPE